MNNRLMVYILVGLVLVGIIYRIANPPPPELPGPVREFPDWKSSVAIGQMTAQAVSPDGTKWAGVWSEETQAGDLRSAVRVIDFARETARTCKLRNDVFAPSLGWRDDSTIWVLLVDSKNPERVAESDVVTVGAKSARVLRTARLSRPVARILAWNPGSKKLLARLAGKEMKLALLSESGEIIGKEVVPELSKGAELFSDAALSHVGGQFVFAVSDLKAAGGRSYYWGRPDLGAAEPLFDLKDVPGRIEGMWISGGVLTADQPAAGRMNTMPVLFLAIGSSHKEKDRFELVRFIERGKLAPREKGDAGKTWVTLLRSATHIPSEMLFVTFSAGYRFDLAAGKAKKLFDLTKYTGLDEHWRQQIRNGRLYPVKGGYVTVSVNADQVDIRRLDKQGKLVRDLLPRM